MSSKSKVEITFSWNRFLVIEFGFNLGLIMIVVIVVDGGAVTPIKLQSSTQNQNKIFYFVKIIFNLFE